MYGITFYTEISFDEENRSCATMLLLESPIQLQGAVQIYRVLM
jgi:hypothetical protein